MDFNEIDEMLLLDEIEELLKYTDYSVYFLYKMHII